MITLPKDALSAASLTGSFRAGGTDLQARRARGLHHGDVIELRDVPGLNTISAGPTGGLKVGALTRIATFAHHAEVQKGYPGLAAAAAGLATPAIREIATVGGNLTQEVRCAYYRNPSLVCLKKGGDACLARGGDHFLHSCFDQGACAAPHPSTIALGMLAWDAQVELADGALLDAAGLYGDGTNPRTTHRLGEGQLIVALNLPAPAAKERSAWRRVSHRNNAEWPIVEAIVRVVVDAAGQVTLARIALGGVGNTPIRALAAEEALVGGPLTEARLMAAGEASVKTASPLPMTRWKLPVVVTCVQDTLRDLLTLETP